LLTRGVLIGGRYTQRLAALVLITTILCTSLIAGCGLIQQSGEEDGIPTIEVGVFDGGFGLDWYESTRDRFLKTRQSQDQPIRVDLWGDPRILDKLRPRILRGSPPDLSNAPLPFWKLVTSDALLPLDEWLDSPADDAPETTWRETFLPGALSPYEYMGQVYSIPLVYNIWVVWYDQTLFEQHGWEPPRTWREWEELCDSILEAGIAPIAFQGKYSQYAAPTLWSTLQRSVGVRKLNRCQNFEQGAFLDPDFIQAADRIQKFAQKYFQEGYVSMSHTEAQMEFCNRRAAMVFCGLWLENEMKNAFPDDFRLGCFGVPRIEGGRGSPRALFANAGESFLVFRKGGNPREAAQFLKFMTTADNATEWVRSVATVSPIRGATPRDEVSEALRMALDLIEQADYTYDDRLTFSSGIFPSFGNEVMTPAISKLLSGSMSPEDFGQTIEEALEKIRNNPDIFKPPPRPIPRNAEPEPST